MPACVWAQIVFTCLGAASCVRASDKDQVGSENCQGPWAELYVIAPDAMICWTDLCSEHIAHISFNLSSFIRPKPIRENIPFLSLLLHYQGPDLRFLGSMEGCV